MPNLKLGFVSARYLFITAEGVFKAEDLSEDLFESINESIVEGSVRIVDLDRLEILLPDLSMQEVPDLDEQDLIA